MNKKDKITEKRCHSTFAAFDEYMNSEFKTYIDLRNKNISALEAAKVAEKDGLNFVETLKMLKDVYRINSFKEAKTLVLESRNVDLEEYSKSILEALEIVFKEIDENK